LLIPRLLIMIISTLFCSLLCNIFMIGTAANDKPISSVRQGCNKFWVKFTAYLHVICGWWAYCTYEYIKCDYEEYLGKQIDTKQLKPTSTIVCNHIGFFEVYTLIISSLSSCFCAKSEFKQVPFFSGILIGLQCLFITRGEKQGKESSLNEIRNR